MQNSMAQIGRRRPICAVESVEPEADFFSPFRTDTPARSRGCLTCRYNNGRFYCGHVLCQREPRGWLRILGARAWGRRSMICKGEVFMSRIAIAVACAAIAGCASIDPKPFTGPDGKPAYSMRCSGMGRTLDACYQKAGEVCPSGYNIIDRSTGTVGVPTSSGMLIAPRESLAIECK